VTPPSKTVQPRLVPAITLLGLLGHSHDRLMDTPFRLLGPVEVVFDGRRAELRRRRERGLLAVLLLEAGRPIPVERLIELLFGDSPSPTARSALRVHVSRLRRSLADAAGPCERVPLVSHRAGYAIQVDPDRVDVHRFTGLLARARHLPEPTDRARLLREALALWRGSAGADLPCELRQRVCGWLEEARLAALELRVEADLAASQHEPLAIELAELTARYPTRERLVAARMLALYRSGRKLEALAAYRSLAGQLAEALGLDPGPRLRQLHAAILRDAV
jgi:DNA-binding SARP family transcriptional activator